MTADALPNLCRGLLQVGLSVLLQSTLLLMVGLLIGAVLRRSRQERAVHVGPVYLATLLGVFFCLVLAFIVRPSGNSVLRIALPSARHIETETVAPTAPNVPVLPQPLVPVPAPVQGNVGVSASAENAVVTAEAPENVPAPSASEAVWPLKPFGGYLSAMPAPDINGPLSAAGWLYLIGAGVWVVGTVTLLGGIVLGGWGAWQLCRAGEPVRDEEIIRTVGELCAAEGIRPPVLRSHPEIPGVCVAGVRRPVLLLPVTFPADFDPAMRRAVLAHEVGHLAGRDPLWTLAFRLAKAVLWMQPLLYLMEREWEQAREEACDLDAVRQGIAPREYANGLVRLAERRMPRRASLLTVSGMDGGVRSSVGRRVQRLLTVGSVAEATRRPVGVVAVAALLGAGLMVVPVSRAVVTAPQGEVPGTPAWKGDARVERKVKVHAEGIALGELFPLISRTTGVRVEASRTIADDKVILYGPSRPLRAVLSDLALLLGCTWSKGETLTDGKPYYVLAPSTKLRRYEEKLAAANEERFLAHLDALVRALNETDEQLKQRPSGDPIRQALSNDQGRLAVSILAKLTLEQRKQLLETWRAHVPVAALAAEQKAGVEDMFFGERFKPDPKTGIAVTPIPREEMDRHAMSVEILAGQGEYRSFFSVWVAAPTGYNMQATAFQADTKFALPAHGNPYTGAPVAETDKLPTPEIIRAAEQVPGIWPDRLRELSEKTGRPVVADYYRSQPVQVPEASSTEGGPGNAVRALDALCRPEGYLWWANADTLLLRKRDWYYQRRFEIPDRWVVALSQRLQAQDNMPTYRDLLALRELTTDQLMGLNGSLGLFSSKLHLGGVHTMLAIVASSTVDLTQTLPDGVIMAGAIQNSRLSVMPDLSLPRIRALVAEFQATTSAGGLGRTEEIKPGQFGFLFHSPNLKRFPLDPKNPGAKPNRVPINVMFYKGRSIGAGYMLALPLGLPNDRRDRTKAEIIP
jgi:beta-lactamase regulating signal transducer with metallopeptidase domain